MNKKKSLKFRTPGVEGWEIKESPRKKQQHKFLPPRGEGSSPSSEFHTRSFLV